MISRGRCLATSSSSSSFKARKDTRVDLDRSAGMAWMKAGARNCSSSILVQPDQNCHQGCQRHIVGQLLFRSATSWYCRWKKKHGPRNTYYYDKYTHYNPIWFPPLKYVNPRWFRQKPLSIIADKNSILISKVKDLALVELAFNAVCFCGFCSIWILLHGSMMFFSCTLKISIARPKVFLRPWTRKTVKPLPWLPAPHETSWWDEAFLSNFPEAALISVAKVWNLCNPDDDVEDTLIKLFF